MGCDQATAKDEPSLESGLGVAFAAGIVLAKRPRNRPPDVPWRFTALAAQAGSLIVPTWPFPVTDDAVKRTVPKFVSGSGRQSPRPQHEDGASAIHSAEVRSGEVIVRFRVKNVRRVLFAIRIDTVFPVTATLAVNESPGASVSLIVTGAAGTSSYQTL